MPDTYGKPDYHVTARLGLKAGALAWLEPAPALSNLRPSQSRRSRLGSGLAWPRPRLLYIVLFYFILPGYKENLLVL